MQLVGNYDRVLVAEGFRHNLEQIVRPERQPVGGIPPAEIRYLAQTLARTCLFGLAESWILQGGVKQFLKLEPETATFAELRHCEWMANNALILEGVVLRSAARKEMEYKQKVLSRSRIQVARELYRKVAHGNTHTSGEKLVVDDIANHVQQWVHHLSRLEGRDQKNLLTPLRGVRLIF